MVRFKSLLASTVFVSLASSAMAADPAAGVYDWTGFYLGAHGGYVSTAASIAGFSERFNGALAGAHAGYNFIQSGPWVFGAEGDVSYTWNSKDLFGLGLIDAGTDWQWSLRARVGYAMDRTMFFGTAGMAGTNAFIAIPLIPIKIEDRMMGWTVGAGIEHAFTQNWLVRGEYRYSNYGEFKPLGFATGINLTEHTLRAGISYKF